MVNNYNKDLKSGKEKVRDIWIIIWTDTLARYCANGKKKNPQDKCVAQCAVRELNAHLIVRCTRYVWWWLKHQQGDIQ